MSDERNFQINLGGMIDLLSNHLYSSPNVYVRELLQNGVDAISARCFDEPDHRGRIDVEVATSDTGMPQLMFTDNGIGLTEDEIHRFLSTIGSSSKREVEERRGDYIGQFGIGLLSCFIVSDEILLTTRSAKPGSPVITWKGRADGTYETKLMDNPDQPFGTMVFLRCKPGAEEWFGAERVRELLRYFGSLLPHDVFLRTEHGEERINAVDVPWRQTHPSSVARRDAEMKFGERLFEQEFFDCIPLRSDVGDVDGVAYILSYSPSPTAKRGHRVYLKNMLLSESSDNLLPSWAFFVTCVVNTNELRPVASRESFYEDDMLQVTRDQLGQALRDYLVGLKNSDPQRLSSLISIHFRAIKALAVYDDEFFELFIDLLPFETSLGRMTLGEFRQQFATVRYVPTVDVFRQIAQVAASQSLGVINAGYSYDADLLEKLGHVFPDIEVERIDSSDLAENFEALSPQELEDAFVLQAMADVVLKPFKCRADIKRFRPDDLPALFLAGENAKFMRTLEKGKEDSDDHWGSILGNLADSQKSDSYAELCFNFGNPLVRKLVRLEDKQVLRLSIQMLYVQSLLLGHHPLSANEMALLNTGLLDLIDVAIAEDPDDWVQ